MFYLYLLNNLILLNNSNNFFFSYFLKKNFYKFNTPVYFFENEFCTELNMLFKKKTLQNIDFTNYFKPVFLYFIHSKVKKYYLLNFFKKISLFFQNIFYTNNNILIFDTFNKPHLLLYSNMYNIKSVISHPNYYFPKKSDVKKKLKRWVLLFDRFCFENRVMFFIVNDFNYWSNNIRELSEFEIPIISIMSGTKNKEIINEIDYCIMSDYLDQHILNMIFHIQIHGIYFYILNLRYKNYKLFFFNTLNKINFL